MIMWFVSTVVEDCKNGRKMKTHGINMPNGFLGKVFLTVFLLHVRVLFTVYYVLMTKHTKKGFRRLTVA